MNCIALMDPKNTKVGTAKAWIVSHLTVNTGYWPTTRNPRIADRWRGYLARTLHATCTRTSYTSQKSQVG